MTRYLLDTDTCIELLNRRSSTVSQRLASLTPAEVVLCSVVKAELYYGVYRSSRRAENLALVGAFCSQFLSIPFNDACVEIYGSLRAGLVQRGSMIGPYDLQIAAISLAHGLTLVTHNLREFSRVPELQWEDWQA